MAALPHPLPEQPGAAQPKRWHAGRVDRVCIISVGAAAGGGCGRLIGMLELYNSYAYTQVLAPAYSGSRYGESLLQL